MRNLNLKYFVVALIATAFSITSCGHKHNENNNPDSVKIEKTIDKSSKEYASAYICPMHCEGSGGDSEGKCPVCGMDYVINPDYNSDTDSKKNESTDAELDQAEDHDHEGHDHDGHTH